MTDNTLIKNIKYIYTWFQNSCKIYCKIDSVRNLSQHNWRETSTLTFWNIFQLTIYSLSIVLKKICDKTVFDSLNICILHYMGKFCIWKCS